MQKGHLVLLHLAALAALLPFLLLAGYCHPYFDDYGTATELKRVGFIEYFGHTYQNWSGRYAFLLANIAHPLRFGGLPAYQIVAGALAMGLAGSCYALGCGLTAGGKMRWPARLAFGSGLVVAFFMLLPSPAEAFYWVLGGYNYLLPILVGLTGVAACCVHAATPTGQCKRPVFLAVAVGMAGLFPGFSEFSACLTLVLAGGLLITTSGRSRAHQLIAAVSILGAVLMLVAPGNVGRLQSSARHELHIWHATVLAIQATAYTLLNWVAFPGFWALALLGLPVFERLASGAGLIASLTRRWWLWPALLIAGIGTCYLFSYLVLLQPPPLRARNLLYGFFIVASLLSVVGGVQHGQRHGWAMPRISAYALLTLLALSLLTDGNTRLRGVAIGGNYSTVGQAYRDWLSGDAQRYDAAQRQRYQLLRSTAADSVALLPLPVTPVTLFYHDLAPTPGLWGNRAMADFFGKKALWVRVPRAGKAASEID